MKPPSIALICDQPIMLDALTALFSSSSRVELVATGTSPEVAVEFAARLDQVIIVMDLSMSERVIQIIGEIKSKFEQTKIVMFTSISAVDIVLRVLDAGASGYILKSSTKEEIVDALTAVHRGEKYFSRKISEKLIAVLRNQAPRAPKEDMLKLSTRESQIVVHLMRGRTNKEIAILLSISEKTVKHYMTALMQKLGARNCLEVVIAAQKKNGALFNGLHPIFLKNSAV